MGYNGSNRRPKRSVIKKSSLNFGTKLVSKMIAVPIAAALEVPTSKRSNRVTNVRTVTDNSYKREIENTISFSLNTINLLTSDKYRHIITDLEKLSKENQILESIMVSKEAELRRLKFRKMLFMLFPNAKKKIKEEILNLKNEIAVLDDKKQEEILDVEELINAEKEEKISSFEKQLAISKPIISNDSISLFDIQRILSSTMLNRVKTQILFTPNLYMNRCPVLTITAQYIDLYFFGAGIIIKHKGMFAIIDYDDIKFEYSEVRIKEDECFNVNGHTLDGYTFLYSRNDGGADLRYSYNPQLPIVKYGKMSLGMNDSSTINIFFSNFDIGSQLYGVIATSGCNYKDIV